MDSLDNELVYNTIKLFINFNKVIFFASTQFSMVVNSLILIDLLLSLLNPFYPRRKRNKYYMIIMFLSFIYVLIIMSNYMRDKNSQHDFYNYHLLDPENTIILLYRINLLSQLALFFFATTRIITILCRKGTSKKLRKKVIKYQLVYFILYIIIIFYNTYDIREFPIISDFVVDLIEQGNMAISLIISILNFAGIFMALNRLFEPYVWREF